MTTAPLLPPSALPATPPPSGDTRNAINTQPADTLAPPAPHIAIILPLNSRTLGKAADAVRQGFLAGANADGKSAPAFRVYSADDEAGSLAAQYRKARSDGANVVVGGVTRDGASMMARESSNYLPSLALNAPGVANENEFPDRFFYISLNLDWEARFGARTAANEGLRRAAILASTSPLSKRVQESFEKEWSRLGGEIAARIAVAGDASEGLRIQTSMERANADVVFLAAEMKVARFARPYLPTGIPVFATSLTIDPRADAVDNLDLDSVRFMEMPWFVQPDHPAVMAYAKPAEPLPIEYERLYALGIDAWRLAQMVMTNDKPKTFVPLDGVTGRITLEGHQFVRQLASGEMRDGRPVLFKPVE
ncbi:MAG: penicillin-binding protein activator [Betaproteobacteria bacterium]